ncbi:MAG: site-specific integrase, partial [Rhodobacterales bacterium]
MPAGGLTAVSPGQRAALAQWLTHIRALDGAAARTVTAYGADVARYMDFLARHQGVAAGTGALLTVPQADLRAWMAHERARGLGPRSLARALSAVKGFTGWLAEREGI